MRLIEMLHKKDSPKGSDVLYAISQGVKTDLEQIYPQFSFTTGARRIKGRGHRVELIASHEVDNIGCRVKALAFKIYFEGDKIRLVDDGFESNLGLGELQEYEYANPEVLDILYQEIDARFG